MTQQEEKTSSICPFLKQMPKKKKSLKAGRYEKFSLLEHANTTYSNGSIQKKRR